jgi:uncharacterized radical SAM protein YgiQ
LNNFLPVCQQDLIDRNIEQLDFIIVTPDAYVDHYSFASAIIGRWLDRLGYSVGIISQPDFKACDSFEVLGIPKYAFLISAGNMDSMVNLFTVNKAPRKKDLYTQGGQTGKRPKRASIVYSNRIREAFGNVPIIIGGIEASLRRFAHYDFWDDKVRNSILLDSGADLLVYGMGEYPLKEIAECFESGMSIKDMMFIDGTSYITDTLENLYDYSLIASFDDVQTDKKKYAMAFKAQYQNQDYRHAKTLVQPHGNKYIVQNPPSVPLATEDFDTVCGLNYQNKPHPMYIDSIPAFEEVKFSITASRGCIGGCAFCSLNFHQGRHVSKRSKKNIIEEAKGLIDRDDFKGYIHDVGGSTANFYGVACNKKDDTPCHRLCLVPTKCKHLNVSHEKYLDILKDLRSLDGVKKVFIRSGLRFDYIMHDDNDRFINDLAKYHISGQLRTAPEHICDNVLNLMNKPSNELYTKFVEKFEKANNKANLNQYILPYFISSHPGSTLDDAIELAQYLKNEGFIPEQVQDFYPTPGTLATCMYYTGLNPLTMKNVYVAKSLEERKMQRALLQFNYPKNRAMVKKALIKAGRLDLIGKSKNCLIYE